MTPRTMLLCLAGLVWLPGAAAAQDQQAVFIHGLGGSGADWEATAGRLQQMTAIEAHTPSLPWRESYDQQAVQLHNALGGLPSSTVAVGHSNGGIVAREWSKHRPLSGIVTIGTPHRGAPLMAAFHRWVGFNAETPSLLNAALNAFTIHTDVTWVWSFVEEAVSWASDFSFWSVVDVASILGFEMFMPVAPQMRPYSPYIADLNSPGNLSREAAAVPNRVGIVSIAHNFFWAGPARAVVPEHADHIAAVLYAAASSFLFWGAYIQTTSAWDDVYRFEQAMTLLNIGSHLMSMDPYYCRVVSRWDLSACFPNDGVVPDESQRFPFAPNLIIGGPAHTQEKEQGVDALREALVWYLHVPARSGSPEPPPPPPGGSGGNAPAPGSAGTLVGGQQITPGDYLRSPNGRFTLVFQSDGNLVLYEPGGGARWDSRTRGSTPGVLSMQFDGNLVIYDAWDGEVWSTGTSGNAGAYLAVLNDGDVVVFDQDGESLWRTGTGS
jgi:pimeloyl-ACP methyl ester carboxylesterase